ncbi:MAG: PQQ-binding-like beta-propeller repeat protein [Coriobacteriia bacterium]|nr:PQQ-binding-like beta-propeller repeat protein [Coriobacteriia bacterium]
MTRRPTYTSRPARVPPGAMSTMRIKRRRRASRLIAPLLVMVVVVVAGALGVRAWTAGDGASTATDQTATTTPTAPGGQEAEPLRLTEDVSLAYPTYLGGAERRSGGRAPAPAALDVLWKLQIGSGTTARVGDGQPVTWSGTGWTGQPTLVYEAGKPWLLIGGYDHGLRRIDATTGTVAWRAQLDDVIKGTNTVYYEPTRPEGDRLVVVTGSRRGNGLELGDPSIAPLRAFSFATGEELWRLPVPRTENYSQDVDASPLRVDGRLIVALEPGYVLALDTSRLVPGPDGHPMPSVVASSPPLYTPDDVIERTVTGGSNLVLEGSPAVLGDRIYIASSAGHVYGLNRTTLAIEWEFVAGGDLDSTVAVTRDGMLLVGMEREYVEHGGVFMLDPRKAADESVVWFFSTEDRGIGEWAGGVVGSIALHPGQPLAAFCSVDGNLYVVHTDRIDGDSPSPDGTQRYPRPVLAFKDHIGGSISTPAIVGDRMVAAGLDQKVHLYDITPTGDQFTITAIATFTADGPFESTPLVWDGRVYIGCRDGYLYCLGQR